MGYDVSGTRSVIKPIQAVLKRVRELGFFVIHTREGHSPDLSDCPQTKHWYAFCSFFSSILDFHQAFS